MVSTYIWGVERGEGGRGRGAYYTFTFEASTCLYHSLVPKHWWWRVQGPLGYSSLEQTVPLSAECPPHLSCWAECTTERWKEKASLEYQAYESSMEDSLWQIYGSTTACLDKIKKNPEMSPSPEGPATTTKQITAHTMCSCRMWTDQNGWYIICLVPCRMWQAGESGW